MTHEDLSQNSSGDLPPQIIVSETALERIFKIWSIIEDSDDKILNSLDLTEFDIIMADNNYVYDSDDD